MLPSASATAKSTFQGNLRHAAHQAHDRAGGDGRGAHLPTPAGAGRPRTARSRRPAALDRNLEARPRRDAERQSRSLRLGDLPGAAADQYNRYVVTNCTDVFYLSGDETDCTLPSGKFVTGGGTNRTWLGPPAPTVHQHQQRHGLRVPTEPRNDARRHRERRVGRGLADVQLQAAEQEHAVDVRLLARRPLRPGHPGGRGRVEFHHGERRPRGRARGRSHARVGATPGTVQASRTGSSARAAQAGASPRARAGGPRSVAVHRPGVALPRGAAAPDARRGRPNVVRARSSRGARPLRLGPPAAAVRAQARPGRAVHHPAARRAACAPAVRRSTHAAARGWT